MVIGYDERVMDFKDFEIKITDVFINSRMVTLDMIFTLATEVNTK